MVVGFCEALEVHFLYNAHSRWLFFAFQKSLKTLAIITAKNKANNRVDSTVYVIHEYGNINKYRKIATRHDLGKEGHKTNSEHGYTTE